MKIVGESRAWMAIWLALLLCGCGGNGGGGASAEKDATSAGRAGLTPAPSFALTTDQYGVENPTYLSATRSTLGIVLRMAVASSMTDPDYRTVLRIDIEDPDAVAAGALYPLGKEGGGAPPPAKLHLFNGHQSTLLQTTGGGIAFSSFGSSAGDLIAGSFSAVILDGNDTSTPKGSYTLAGNFTFTVGEDGPILPTPLPVPAGAESLYHARCGSCHALGTLDTTGAPDLALKGGKAGSLFTAGSAGHNGLLLNAGEIAALRVLFNVN